MLLLLGLARRWPHPVGLLSLLVLGWLSASLLRSVLWSGFASLLRSVLWSGFAVAPVAASLVPTALERALARFEAEKPRRLVARGVVARATSGPPWQ